MLPEFGSQISCCGPKLGIGVSLFHSLLVNPGGKQQHQYKEQNKNTEKKKRKKRRNGMSGVLPVIHEAFPPFALPDRAITLIDGRRLEPLGTYSTTNLVLS